MYSMKQLIFIQKTLEKNGYKYKMEYFEKKIKKILGKIRENADLEIQFGSTHPGL